MGVQYKSGWKIFMAVCFAMPWAGCIVSVQAGEMMEKGAYLMPRNLIEGLKDGKVVKGAKELGPVDVHGIPLRAYDVREWFEGVGMLFPVGSEAVYLPEANLLISKNTANNTDLLDALIWPCCGVQPTGVRTDFYLVSFHLPSPESERSFKFSELRAAAGDSWKVVSAVTLLSRSGERVRGGGVIGSSTAKAGESVKADASVIIGPDGGTMEASVQYHYQGRGADGRILELSAKSDFTTQSGLPRVVQLFAPAAGGEPSYAILVRSYVKYPWNEFFLMEDSPSTLIETK